MINRLYLSLSPVYYTPQKPNDTSKTKKEVEMSLSMSFEPTLEQLYKSEVEQNKIVKRERLKLKKMLFSILDCLSNHFELTDIPAEIDYSFDIKFMYDTYRKYPDLGVEWIPVPLSSDDKEQDE
jgi:hypothetical protein